MNLMNCLDIHNLSDQELLRSAPSSGSAPLILGIVVGARGPTPCTTCGPNPCAGGPAPCAAGGLAPCAGNPATCASGPTPCAGCQAPCTTVDPAPYTRGLQLLELGLQLL